MKCLAALAIVLFALVTACGGQSRESRAESAAAGPPKNDVPTTTLREHDWSAAARGHGAAGSISSAELERLEKLSAPGASLDGGAKPAQ